MIVRLVSGKQSDVTVMQSNHVNNRNGLYQTVLHHREIKKLEGCTFLRLFLQKDPYICIIFEIMIRKEGAVSTVHPSMYFASYSGVRVKWIGSFSDVWDNSHFRSVIAYQSNLQWYTNSCVHQRKRDNWMWFLFHFTNHDFYSYGCVYLLSLARVRSIFLHKSGISQLLWIELSFSIFEVNPILYIIILRYKVFCSSYSLHSCTISPKESHIILLRAKVAVFYLFHHVTFPHSFCALYSRYAYWNNLFLRKSKSSLHPIRWLFSINSTTLVAL